MVRWLPTGLQLALSGAQMTQNQKLSLLPSTSRDHHGTDLIYTDWSFSKPSNVTSQPLFSTTQLQIWIGNFLSWGVNLFNLCFMPIIYFYKSILYRCRKVCIYLPISISFYFSYYCFFMVLLLNSEKVLISKEKKDIEKRKAVLLFIEGLIHWKEVPHLRDYCYSLSLKGKCCVHFSKDLQPYYVQDVSDGTLLNCLMIQLEVIQ